MTRVVLSIRDLEVEFATRDGVVHAVQGLTYDVRAGETVGIVGESGCGKSASALAILRLLPRAGRIERGEILLESRDLLRMPAPALRRVRGNEVAMVFQDPMTSLHPLLPIGRQVGEALRAHAPGLSNRAVRTRTIELLRLVGIPDPRVRMRGYAHEWSGGMRQRAMIAMAIANKPKVLIADEPTTALDVTVQAQILDLLRVAQAETGAALILITHDLGVIAEMADTVLVMYAGRAVERGRVEQVFRTPRHPYTLALMANVPRPDVDLQRLDPIPGQPPDLVAPPSGCAFHPRCRLQSGRVRCEEAIPPLAATDAPGHHAACHFWPEMDAEASAVAADTGIDLTGRSP